MRVTMIGTGYVGLVTGACFAEFGFHVTCVDRDKNKVARLNSGEIPIFEPKLDELVADNAKAGRLSFTTDLGPAVAVADAVFIGVGTPAGDDGHADLSQVYGVADEIAAALDGYTVIVTKSTVPVGTGDEVEGIVRKRRPDAEFDVVSNPEFLREGAAIDDFMRPDRVVIGTSSERAREVMAALYRSLDADESPILFTSRRTSELIKYAANSFLATKIAFINEIADLCEKADAYVGDVARGIGLDSRIGEKFLNAGPGYGGSCFPKDAQALVRTAERYGAAMRIVDTVVAVNQVRKKAMAGRVIEACGGSVKGKTIAVLGVTFKADTDDMREAVSLEMVPALQAAGAVVRAFDPEGMDEAKELLGGVEWCEDAYQTMDAADAVVIVTEWNQFRQLDLERAKSLLKSPVMVDLRNLYRPQDMTAAGFRYHSIGRPSSGA